MTDVPIIEPSAGVRAARHKWRYVGRDRPGFAVPPGQGEESVWDYPRPPRIEPVRRRVVVRLGGDTVASSRAAVRVVETAGAPTYYVPPDDVDASRLAFGGSRSVCEWKGVAEGFAVGDVADAGWRYVQMFREFAELYLWCAFFPGRIECFLDDERVGAQPGGYYGGWVTADLVGPIKGEPGSAGW